MIGSYISQSWFIFHNSNFCFLNWHLSWRAYKWITYWILCLNTILKKQSFFFFCIAYMTFSETQHFFLYFLLPMTSLKLIKESTSKYKFSQVTYTCSFTLLMWSNTLFFVYKTYIWRVKGGLDVVSNLLNSVQVFTFPPSCPITHVTDALHFHIVFLLHASCPPSYL